MSYHVVYSVMGEIRKDSFQDLESASADYREKARLDKLGVFDDRFVVGIEDDNGVKIDVRTIYP